MPVITNVGGSITSAVALTLLAWAVETDPAPHCVVDVRSAKAVEQAPLPADLQTAIHLPAGEVYGALASRCAAWPSRFPSVPTPGRDCLLVFLGDSEEDARAAATEAAAAGFERGMVLAGGLRVYAHAARTQADLKYVGRGALAVLLGLAGDGAPRCESACVLDVRRGDERALYGSIPGTVHVPVDQLPAALQLAPGDWEAAYRCPKPDMNTWLVLQSRTCRRAAWAAQGVYGWRASLAIRAYRAYRRGEAPPEPEACLLEPVSAATGRSELAQLGLHL